MTQDKTNRSDYYYDLPSELIAHSPVSPRDSSNLLVFSDNKIEHKTFTDIINYLNPEDVLVFNDTKVIKARLYAKKRGNERDFEILLLKQLASFEWECLVRPAKKAKIGDELFVGDSLSLKIIGFSKATGVRTIKLSYEGEIYELLDEIGKVPLPPYINNDECELSLYQTVYAKHQGSVAAPTAGLHFTDNLLNSIRERGIKVAYVTLHVGLGTFRPVKEKYIEDHKMHSESFHLSIEDANIINNARDTNHRVIAVGTTVARTLESIYRTNEDISAGEGETDIFIFPPFNFKVIDGMITNFHLPESTLLMLVSAFSGKDVIKNIYKEAIDKRYRFYSFGDAMLLLK